MSHLPGPRPHRRSVVPGTAVVASLLAAAATAAAATLALTVAAPAAHAAEYCTSTTEVAPTVAGIPTGPGCDDVVTPESRIASLTPKPNDLRYLRSDRISIRFSGRHVDDDTDPIVHECQFYATATAPATWEPCTSPFVKADLAESGALPYTFRVRSVDQPDNANDLTSEVHFPHQQDTDVPDVEQTPATARFSVDTVAPNTFINGLPVDNIRPDWPVVDKSSPKFTIRSDSATSQVVCRLNGAKFPCAEGSTTFKNLRSGSKLLKVKTYDLAGNPDPTPSRYRFFVPENLTTDQASSAWRRVRLGGYVGGDLLEARRAGAMVRVFGKGVRELRLIAPAGPDLGKLVVNIGGGKKYVVDLRSATEERRHHYVVRDEFSPLVTGMIRIRAKTNRLVRVDAIVARR